MFHLRRWLYFLTHLFSVSTFDTFANFRRTAIINDSCDFSSKLETLPTSLLECGVWCGQDENCRRFLHSRNSLLCTLYSDGNNCIVNGNSSGYRCFVKSLGCIADICTCPRGYYGNNCTQIATDCKDYAERGFWTPKTHALTNIQPNSFYSPFEVYCYLESSGGINILYRHDTCSMENFNRSMQEYEAGFGNVPWNRWLGFDKILSIMHNRPDKPVTLQVLIKNSTGSLFTSRYKVVTIGDSTTQYRFSAEKYEKFFGLPGGDSIMGSNGSVDLSSRPFSTYDNDSTKSNCPGKLGGGWWFARAMTGNCSDSFATGSAMADNYWRNTLNDQYISWFSLSIAHY